METSWSTSLDTMTRYTKWIVSHTHTCTLVPNMPGNRPNWYITKVTTKCLSVCVPQGSDVDSAASVYSETNTVTVNSLIPGSIYAFQIRARNERGYGPYSNTIYFTTLPLGTTLCYCNTSEIHFSQSASLQLTHAWRGGIYHIRVRGLNNVQKRTTMRVRRRIHITTLWSTNYW